MRVFILNYDTKEGADEEDILVYFRANAEAPVLPIALGELDPYAMSNKRDYWVIHQKLNSSCGFHPELDKEISNMYAYTKERAEIMLKKTDKKGLYYSIMLDTGLNTHRENIIERSDLIVSNKTENDFFSQNNLRRIFDQIIRLEKASVNAQISGLKRKRTDIFDNKKEGTAENLHRPAVRKKLKQNASESRFFQNISSASNSNNVVENIPTPSYRLVQSNKS